MDPQLLLCSDLREKAFVFSCFAIYLRSITLSLLWNVELSAKSYYCYACNEYLPFSTEVGSVVATISFMRLVNIIVWVVSVTFLICSVLHRYGKITDLQLAYISDLNNKYNVVATSFVAMRIIWNHNGINLVMQFVNSSGTSICSDIPTWMIPNLQKIAISILIFVLEFGSLIRAREISFEWKRLAKRAYLKSQIPMNENAVTFNNHMVIRHII